MAPKSSKPVPPALPRHIAAAAADVSSSAAAAKAKSKPPTPKKAPPMLVQCQVAFESGDATGFQDPPYVGTMPKFATARRAAETGKGLAGGTALDVMPKGHTEHLAARDSIRCTAVHRQAGWLQESHVTKALYAPKDGQPLTSPGFLVQDSWMNPVVRSNTPWVGYTFFEMKDGAAEAMGNYVEPAAAAKHVPWPTLATRSTSEEVHEIGRPYRPHYEPGLHVGPLRNERGVIGSGSKTLSSHEFQLALCQESYVAMDDNMPTIGYAPGGVIER
eukprot:s386_g36.t1